MTTPNEVIIIANGNNHKELTTGLNKKLTRKNVHINIRADIDKALKNGQLNTIETIFNNTHRINRKPKTVLLNKVLCTS